VTGDEQIVPNSFHEHHLKIMPLYFNAVVEGNKNFEVRYDDRDYRIGDTLVLQEWKKEPFPSREGSYTGRECRRTVTYILSGVEWGMQPSYVVMGLRDETSNVAEVEREFESLLAQEVIGK